MGVFSQYANKPAPSNNDKFLIDDVTDPTTPTGMEKTVTLGQMLGVTVWPSGDVTGVTDAAAVNAAVTAMGTSSGTITLMPGQWYWQPGAVSAIQLANTQTIVVNGRYGAIINAVSGGAAGDMLRMLNPNSQGGGGVATQFQSRRSGVIGVTIDGTNAPTGSRGLHIGDLSSPQCDLIVQNFTGAGDIGIWIDNTVSWTEEADFRGLIENCTTCVQMEVTTGYNSWAYSVWDFTLRAKAGQDGVVLKNGATPYNGKLRIRGNMGASSSVQSNACLRLTGAAPGGTPNAGAWSGIAWQNMDVQVECNSDGGTNGPYTIFIDTDCYITECEGILSFLTAGGTWRPCNIVLATTSSSFQFRSFNGIINGDLSLNPGGSVGAQATFGGPVVFTQAPIPVIGSNAFATTASGDFFALTLAANTTVQPSAAGVQQSGPQRKTYLISQPSVGGTYNYTVSWPSTGSPSMTSPTVIWLGTPLTPQMPTGLGAQMKVELATFDGATWLGVVSASTGIAGDLLVQNPTSYANGTFVGQVAAGQFSNFNLADSTFPLDQNPGGHYWAFSHRFDHSLLIFNYNGSGTYTNELAITEAGKISSLASVLDDSTGNIVLGGGLSSKVRSISASGAVSTTDSVVLLNAATLAATLPTAVGITGRQYTFKMTTASTGTVVTTSAQTIDGAASYSLTANHKYVTIVSDGANWQITANN